MNNCISNTEHFVCYPKRPDQFKSMNLNVPQAHTNYKMGANQVPEASAKLNIYLQMLADISCVHTIHIIENNFLIISWICLFRLMSKFGTNLDLFILKVDDISLCYKWSCIITDSISETIWKCISYYRNIIIIHLFT